MDIVYIFNGWKNGEEMRWSMRSIEKNGLNVGRVWLLGKKPAWCSEEVTEISYTSDKSLYKENDITRAIFHAAHEPELPNRFLICADDYFYIEPTDFDNYPIFLKNAELPNTTIGKEKMGGIKYVRSLVNTRALLTAAGLPFANYSHHCCFPADKKLMAEFKHVFDAAMLLECGAVFDSLMANIIVDKEGLQPVPRHDNKIKTVRDLRELRQLIGEHEHCFSTHERALDYGVRTVLRQLFPDKSKYEL